ncbi:MAG: hypothetical protein V2A72_00615 [Candidatus Omnitrophota bacterium]
MMEKQKAEKLILIVLLPIFALGLASKFIGSFKKAPAPETLEAASSAQAQPFIEEEQKTLEKIKAELKKAEYKALDAIDPLKDQFFVYMVGMLPNMQTKLLKAQGVEPPKISISGLVWNSDRPQVIANGKVFSVGDQIEGAKLLSVDKNGITVEYKGIEFFVKK